MEGKDRRGREGSDMVEREGGRERKEKTIIRFEEARKVAKSQPTPDLWENWPSLLLTLSLNLIFPPSSPALSLFLPSIPLFSQPLLYPPSIPRSRGKELGLREGKEGWGREGGLREGGSTGERKSVGGRGLETYDRLD